ncbi:MAG: OB-fold nucleic acid binding domain-containing protein [Nanoarchaeota archaeon]|nr:OB-fold nucleic acid binding domain-containing protein [Nanoarchaeota archaeon]
MPEPEFKRNIAYKLRINDILIGKPIINQERFAFLELGDKKIIRVNIIGNIIEKYNSEGEKRYSFVTVDDGSGQIKLKSFGDDVEKLNEIVQGQTALVIGVLRSFNNEVYISPEIIKVLPPEYLLVRKLEIEKQKSINSPPLEKEKIIAIKDSLLKMIKEAEPEGGLDADKIILTLSDFSPDMLNQEIKKLLEEGIIFEPRPGKLRYLG